MWKWNPELSGLVRKFFNNTGERCRFENQVEMGLLMLVVGKTYKSRCLLNVQG